MARKPSPSPESRELTVPEMETGIKRIKKRVQILKEFDVKKMSGYSDPQIEKISKSIEQALSDTFGKGTDDYQRYLSAVYFGSATVAYGHEIPLNQIKEEIESNINSALATLNQAIETLEERIEFSRPNLEEEFTRHHKSDIDMHKIFVVHGHDGEAKQSVARYLEKIGFEAIILHEKANQNLTIFEKFEKHSEVGFAVVLLTPDDKMADGQMRSRQNVIYELGYFTGKFGRSKVCSLKKGEVELPSDLSGVLWTNMDDDGAWQQQLARELEAADYKIDWNKVMK